ncbi:hypothetical protein EBU94_08845 [bacterium]|nr:hypothetical protein [bacterium]
MKFVITESRLEDTIMNYLDELFDIQNLNWTHPYEYNDETGEEGEDENRIEFYIGDYEGEEEGCFRWYDCDYFNEGSPAQDICPTINIENEYVNVLNGYFGDLWQETFKKWIDLHFDLPVKTVDWF